VYGVLQEIETGFIQNGYLDELSIAKKQVLDKGSFRKRRSVEDPLAFHLDKTR
jgi:hypothetical protein